MLKVNQTLQCIMFKDLKYVYVYDCAKLETVMRLDTCFVHDSEYKQVS